MTRTSEAVSASIRLRAVVDDSGLAVDVVDETLPPGALDLPVRWAHVSELRNPAPYLLGDELLLTAGVNLPAQQGEVDGYVRGLLTAGVTALGFGVTPPMHDELPDSLRAACVRHKLPLLVVPPRTPFLAISRAVAVALNDAAQREQRRLTDAREALTRSAAGGLGELTRELAQRLSGWVALVGSDDALVAEHGPPQPLPAELTELLARLRSGSGIRSATTELADGTYVVAQPVYPQATASQLLVAGRKQRFEGTERAIIAVGAALLGLVGRAGSDTAALGAAVTALVLENSPPDTVLNDLLPAQQYRVVAGTAHGSGPSGPAAGYEWLCARLGTVLVQLTEGVRFTAIVSAAPAEATLDELRSHGWLVVVSRAHPAERLPGTAPELEALTQRAHALGRSVLADTAGLGLSSVVPPQAAVSFATEALAPLRRIDEARGGDKLVETLRAWLAHHGSWDRTASTLGVHRNSVRHRIGQAERALGVDLSDPQIRMELWFALRWMP